MIRQMQPSYHLDDQCITAIFDVCVPGAAERLQRERDAWKEDATIESLAENNRLLIIRPGGALRLLS